MVDIEKDPNNVPLLFVSYPSEGRALIARVKGNGGCRCGYGLRHQQYTGQTCCAYCGLDFTSRYENWLMMALDHVVPASVCLEASIPIEWMDDHANRVLCCSACNGFKNRWQPAEPLVCPTSLEGFFDLRDSIFVIRREHILQSQADARAFFERKLWDNRL